MGDIITPNSNIVTPGNSGGTIKFDQYKIHDELIIIRDHNKKFVIGYVAKHPGEFWFWFFMSDISFIMKENDGKFETSEDATEDLAQTFITYKMNAMAKKTGIINDPNLVKK